jgi:hypothetical protein
VSRVVPFGTFVAATNEFTEHAKTADAASELPRDVFGKQSIATRHRRGEPAVRFVD